LTFFNYFEPIFLRKNCMTILFVKNGV